jgi:asparagine synthase (glutamine-hydrolysing)
MCGITGIWDRRPGRARHLEGPVTAMATAIAHRGPDDAGIFTDQVEGIALGSRRLAIVDLSPLGHQPMASNDGRYVIAFNGEIYNYRALRRELESLGERFRGGSDTEVLVCGIERFGLREMLKRCNGMFGLAVWDRVERRLRLARDRFGEKPLYYGWSGSTFLFGSELKALKAHPSFSPQIDRNVLALYFRHNCVPAPYTIYRDVMQLKAGSILTLRADAPEGYLPDPEPFWTLRQVAEEGLLERSAKNASDDRAVREATDELEAVLGEAVRMRMHADVPLGAFLSGGIDSSVVVALMHKNNLSKVKTFTIAFEDARFDEASDAKRVAAHLGTDHTEMMVTEKEALQAIAKLPTLYDEPFADSSEIPTSLLSALTREHVTVALSGDGGDEMFGGYNRYSWAEKFWRRVEPIPQPLRRIAGGALSRVPPATVDKAFNRAGRLVPKSLQVRLPGMKVQKAGRVLPAANLHETYRLLASHFDDPEQVVIGATEPPSLVTSPRRWPTGLSGTELMIYLDSMTYLPDDILTKVDRATMGVSLEGRVPFLDPDVASFAWSLPMDLKIRNGTGKWLLRQLLYRHVPQSLVDRPKMGFGIPLGSWLRDPLKAWAGDLLNRDRLRREGYLSAGVVGRLWDDHQSGRADHEYELWDVLMFQAWMEQHNAGT